MWLRKKVATRLAQIATVSTFHFRSMAYDYAQMHLSSPMRKYRVGAHVP